MARHSGCARQRAAGVLLLAFFLVTAAARQLAQQTTTVKGTLSMVAIHFEATDPAVDYTLTTSSGQQYRLTQVQHGPTWYTGMQITATGALSADGATLAVSEMKLPAVVGAAREDGTAAAIAGTNAAPASMSILAIRITACGQEPPFSEQDVQDVLYSGAGLTLAGAWSSCSLGKTTLTPQNAKVVSVNIGCGVNPPNKACDAYNSWAATAQAVVRKKGLANLDDYKFHAMLLPQNADCGWAGMGQMSCTGPGCISWYTHTTSMKLATYLHEIGHGLGLDHAIQDGTTYKDTSTPMGYCCMTRCFNQANMYNLGWSKLVNTATTYNAGQSRTMTLPRADSATASVAAVQANWISNNFNVFMNYRGDASGFNGYDADLAGEYQNQVSIISYGGGAATTTYLGFLNADSPVWRQGDLVVRLNSVDAERGATISVCRAPAATETQCGDGVDNDCDGLIDQDDPDCALVTPPASPLPPPLPSPLPPPLPSPIPSPLPPPLPTPIPDSPLPIPDSPLPIPDSPTPIPDSPMPMPDSPTPIPDSPMPIPDSPTPMPESPAPIPDSPTPSPDVNRRQPASPLKKKTPRRIPRKSPKKSPKPKPSPPPSPIPRKRKHYYPRRWGGGSDWHGNNWWSSGWNNNNDDDDNSNNSSMKCTQSGNVITCTSTVVVTKGGGR